VSFWSSRGLKSPGFPGQYPVDFCFAAIEEQRPLDLEAMRSGDAESSIIISGVL
jgi:hypothetical protein